MRVGPSGNELWHGRVALVRCIGRSVFQIEAAGAGWELEDKGTGKLGVDREVNRACP